MDIISLYFKVTPVEHHKKKREQSMLAALKKRTSLIVFFFDNLVHLDHDSQIVNCLKTVGIYPKSNGVMYSLKDLAVESVLKTPQPIDSLPSPILQCYLLQRKKISCHQFFSDNLTNLHLDRTKSCGESGIEDKLVKQMKILKF